MPEAFTPGDEFTPADAFVVNGFAAYAGTASHDPDQPATPIVLLDLTGYSQTDLPIPDGGEVPVRTLRLIFEERGATETAQGIINCLRQLDAVRRNQER